ncbi:MAG: hypothetical protein LBL91_05620 [Lachnospiraceae bacterium]|jgi:hypothetical protein|nr:hypothetical protein [Lachnospiraceae bacterium]
MEEKKDKYSSQKKHLREKYERFPLDLKNGLKDRFKKTCIEQGTTATKQLQKFILDYLEKYEKSVK